MGKVEMLGEELWSILRSLSLYLYPSSTHAFCVFLPSFLPSLARCFHFGSSCTATTAAMKPWQGAREPTGPGHVLYFRNVLTPCTLRYVGAPILLAWVRSEESWG